MLDKMLVRFARRRANEAIHVCNGDVHPCNSNLNDKSENSRLWQVDQDETDAKLETLAKALGYTVHYPGLYPVFTKDGQDFHIGG